MFLETLFRTGQSWQEKTLATLQLNVIEFLQDETRDLPAMAEAELFYQHVAELQCFELALTEKLNRLTTQKMQGN